MQLKIDGKPYIYKHDCAPEESGRALTKTEIHDFLVCSLIESFEKRGTSCIRHTPDFNSGADFSYSKVGRTICGVVLLPPSSENDISKILGVLFSDSFSDIYPELAEGYKKHGSIPIFFIPELKCLDIDSVIPIAGGRYEIKFSPIQVLANRIPIQGENISEYEMYRGYARCWQSGDTSFLKDYVSTYFHGVSEFSFDEITSKEELLNRVERKHEELKTTHQSISTSLAKDNNTGEKGILFRLGGKDICFVTLSFSGYRISSSHTKFPPSDYEPWDKAYELYETHGDHHSPFVNDEDLPGFIKEMMENSTICLKLDTEVKFDDNAPVKTKVASLKFMCDADIDDIAYLALVAYNPFNNTNVFVSCYPYLKGKPIKVEIVDILEWDNKLEATIKCCYSHDDEEFYFHFFATDYYFNKEYYKIGAKIEIALAASTGNAKEASKGFTFEGQRAIEFLAKIGKEPTYNDKGELEPVRFSTENLVAYLPNDDKCPDMAEFQSPTRDLFYDSFYNNSINRCLIRLHNDPDLEAPLYFNDGFEPKKGEPIMGCLWLSGRLSDPCNMSNSVTKKITALQMEKTTVGFLQSLSKIKPRSIVDATSVLDTLKDLSIPEGKHLFGVRIGNTSRYKYEFFVADFSLLATIQSCINIDGFIGWESEHIFDDSTESLDTILNGNGINAVWQSFLLSIAGKFMPHSKTYSSEFSYILTKEDAEQGSRALNGQIRNLSLLPVFSKDKNGSGYFSVMVWDNGELYRQVYTYTIGSNRISFILDESYKVLDSVDYERDDSHFLFRE